MNIIPYRTKSGHLVRVEVAEAESIPIGRSKVTRSGAKEFVDDASTYLEDTFQVIEIISDGVVENSRRSKAIPKEVEVQIGLKLVGEMNAIIAKNAFEGNIQLTLKWEF